MGGKDVRAALKQTTGGPRMLVPVVEQGGGLVPGGLEIATKTNGFPAPGELVGGLSLAGCVVTADALYAQHRTARCLLDSSRANYAISAIKDEQPTIPIDLCDLDFSAWPTSETLGKEYGRIDCSHYWIKDCSDLELDGYSGLYGDRRALRIERERHLFRSGETSTNVTYVLTWLARDRASPDQLVALVRNHWHIENRLHHVRNLLSRLVCLTKTAISIGRCQAEFRYVSVANRDYASPPAESSRLAAGPLVCWPMDLSPACSLTPSQTSRHHRIRACHQAVHFARDIGQPRA